MQIVCSTTSAAAQVMKILFAARLRPRYDFQISPVLSTTPPVVFTIDPLLVDGSLPTIRAIADTTIETEAAT
jgi:hypothetical protein